MKTTENFQVISTEQLREINGGGFAYDVGRVLRFIGITYAEGIYSACADWVATDVASQYFVGNS